MNASTPPISASLEKGHKPDVLNPMTSPPVGRERARIRDAISAIVTKPRSFSSFTVNVGNFRHVCDNETEFMTVKEARRISESIFSDLNALLFTLADCSEPQERGEP